MAAGTHIRDHAAIRPLISRHVAARDRDPWQVRAPHRGIGHDDIAGRPVGHRSESDGEMRRAGVPLPR